MIAFRRFMERTAVEWHQVSGSIRTETGLEAEKGGMKKFEVRLHGESFLFHQDGEHGKYGFYARRFVKAENPEEAGRLAVILTRQSPIITENLVQEGLVSPVIRAIQVKSAGTMRYFMKKSSFDIEFYSEDDE